MKNFESVKSFPKNHPIWTTVLLGILGSLIAAYVFPGVYLIFGTIKNKVTLIHIPDLVIIFLTFFLFIFYQGISNKIKKKIRLKYPVISIHILEELAKRDDKTIEKQNIYSIITRHSPLLLKSDKNILLEDMIEANIIEGYPSMYMDDNSYYYSITKTGLDFLYKATRKQRR